LKKNKLNIYNDIKSIQQPAMYAAHNERTGSQRQLSRYAVGGRNATINCKISTMCRSSTLPDQERHLDVGVLVMKKNFTG
jgi:hypothetical protein